MRAGKAVEEDERQDTKWSPLEEQKPVRCEKSCIPLIGRRMNQSIHAEKDGKIERKSRKMFRPQGFISSEKSRERVEKFECIEGSGERGEKVKR